MWASQRAIGGKPECVELLIAAGADVNLQDDGGVRDVIHEGRGGVVVGGVGGVSVGVGVGVGVDRVGAGVRGGMRWMVVGRGAHAHVDPRTALSHALPHHGTNEPLPSPPPLANRKRC